MPNRLLIEPAPRHFTQLLYRFLISRKLAFFLIAALNSAVVAAAFIPQYGLLTASQVQALKEQRPVYFAVLTKTGLADVYNSWWFYGLVILFLVNALFCTIKRIQDLLGERGRWLSSDVSVGLERRIKATRPLSVESSSEALRSMEAALTKKGYELDGDGGVLVGRKHGWGRLGTVLLHASFLVIALGVLIGRTTFMNGTVELVEGQGFIDNHAGYGSLKEGFLFGEDHLGFEVRLEKFTTEFWKDGGSKARESTIGIYDNGRKVVEQKISPNYPAVYRGRSIYQYNSYGHSAILKFKEESGEKIGSINFSTPKLGSSSKNTIIIPGTSYQLDATYYPDFGSQRIDQDWKGFPPKDPALRIKALDITNKRSTSGLLKPGDFLDLGNGTLTFQEMRRWTQLGVVREAGAPMVFLGFWMSLAGTVMLYFVVPKKIWVLADETAQGDVLYVAGVTARYKASFSEFLEGLRESVSDKPKKEVSTGATV